MSGNPQVDSARLSIAKHVIALLEEKKHSVSVLVQQSDEHCCKGNFAKSIECCRNAYELAESKSDYAAQASTLIHLGFHFFVSRETEFDRAVDQFEKAAQLYHNAYNSRAEIVSFIGAGLVLCYACKRGFNRWHRAMRMYLLATEVEGAPTNLINRACTLRDSTEREFGRRIGAIIDVTPSGQSRISQPGDERISANSSVVSQPVDPTLGGEGIVMNLSAHSQSGNSRRDREGDPLVPSQPIDPIAGDGSVANPLVPGQSGDPQSGGNRTSSNALHAGQPIDLSVVGGTVNPSLPTQLGKLQEDDEKAFSKRATSSQLDDLSADRTGGKTNFLLFTPYVPIVPREFTNDPVGRFPKFLGYVSIFGFLILCIFLLFDLGYFISVRPEVVLAFMTGLFLFFFGGPIILIVILIGAHQVRLRIPQYHAAILNERGRLSVISSPKIRWLVPLVEYAEIYMPIGWQTINVFSRPVTANDGSRFVVRARVIYNVGNPMIVWAETIRPSSPKPKFMGMPMPIDASWSADFIKGKVRQLTIDVLQQIANTQRDVLRNQRTVNAQVSQLLAYRASIMGLRVYSVQVEFFLQ